MRDLILPVVIGLLALFGVFAASGCSNGYRYACQDPHNWELPECNAPLCTSTGSCPGDVLPSCGALVGRNCGGM